MSEAICGQAIVDRIVASSWEDRAWTTNELADLLGCKERQVRGAVTWLVLGGVVIPAGQERRACLQGKRYVAQRYRLNQSSRTVYRLTRTVSGFRVAETPEADRRLAMDLISRPWL